MGTDNTSDEAERLLDELIGAYVHPGDSTDLQSTKERLGLFNKALPLIRSGLALQRLEKSGASAMIYRDPIRGDKMCCMVTLKCAVQRLNKRKTITAAINAALDAAGVE